MMDSSVNTANLSRFDQILHWAERHNLGPKLAIGLTIAALLSVAATYFLLTGASFEVSSDAVIAILLVDLVLLLALGALIAQRLARLWAARRSGLVGSGLHVRLVGIFSIVAIAPTIVVVTASTLFFERGIENWFDERVKRVLDSSLSVAEAYTNEHRRVIEADILAMANDLNRQAPILSRNLSRFEQVVTAQAALRSLSEAIVFDSRGRVLAKANLTFSLGIDRLPKSLIQQAADGDVVIVPSDTDDQLQALVRLDSFFDTYLYISRFIDPRVVGHVENARETVANYRQVESELENIQTIFNALFIVLALLVLLAAVWMGLWLATRLVMPLTNLVVAADRVAQGDFSVRVEEGREDDEISRLSRAFNRMTGQLHSQHAELLNANEQLDARRRFTETVLSGVSAGVIGLDPNGVIDLPNRSAVRLLGETPKSLVGRRIEDAIPEMADLVRRARMRPSLKAEDRVRIVRGDHAYLFLVRVSAESEGDEIKGFVVTFDDITKLEAAQRTAAWADVARRIAHEIKNPLTPIQLSAERLRRKYEKKVDADEGVFAQCTDTIIRHVGDIRRMVDEFSAFARMPAPVFKRENIVDLLRQAVFSQEVTAPHIRFTTDVETDSIEINCDGRQMSQVFTNILKNAVESINDKQASGGDSDSTGGEIAISITDDGDCVDIEIADNGIGLPDLPPEHLIEPYVTTHEKGTGLGLAIVEKVIKDHSGDFTIKSGKEGGAVARIILRRSRVKDAGRKNARREKEISEP